MRRVVLGGFVILISSILFLRGGLLIAVAGDFFHTNECKGKTLEISEQFFEDVLLVSFFQSRGEERNWLIFFPKTGPDESSIDVSEKVERFFKESGIEEVAIEIISCLSRNVIIYDSPFIYNLKEGMSDVKVAKLASMKKFIIKKIPNDVIFPKEMVFNVSIVKDKHEKLKVNEATITKFLYSMY